MATATTGTLATKKKATRKRATTKVTKKKKAAKSSKPEQELQLADMPDYDFWGNGAKKPSRDREQAAETGTPEQGRTAGLPGRQAAWECPNCGEYQAGRQPSCIACSVAHRPGLSENQRMLIWLLEPDRETQGMWSMLREEDQPPGDLWLMDRIATVLNLQPEIAKSTPVGFVSWQVDEGNPLVWFGDQIECGKRPPDLDGEDLVEVVRGLWGIPSSAESSADEGETPPAKKPKRATKKRRTKKPTAVDQQIHETVCPTGIEEATTKQAATKRTPAAQSNGAQPSTLDSGLVPAGTRLDVRMSYIVPSPFQPRTEFDQEKLKQLGASIKEHGQTSDCLVRQIGKNKFELIGGERRFRACKLVKLKTLACKVIVADDKKARSLAVFDNLDREDLNEIDRIRAYRDLLDNGVYATQDELAQSIGMKPASLSNLLRILKLPADWLEMISQEMLPVTHARYVIPWAERPAVLEALKSELLDCEGTYDVSDWQYTIKCTLKEQSKPLSGEFFGRRPGDQYSGWHKVRLTKKEQGLEDLDVVDVKGLGKRAFNIDLWEKLQTAGEERAAKRAGAKSNSSANGKQETAADVAAKEKKRQEQFAKKLWIYKIGWLQRRLADVIRTKEPCAGGEDQQRMLSLLLFFTECSTDGAEILVSEALEQAGAKSRKSNGNGWTEIVAGDCRQLWEAARTSAAAWVQQNPFTFHNCLSDRTIEAMCESFGVDVKRDWTLERDYLELLNKDQLWELIGEWKLSSHAMWAGGISSYKRTELIDGMLSVGERKRVKCPKALAAAKRPNGFYF